MSLFTRHLTRVALIALPFVSGASALAQDAVKHAADAAHAATEGAHAAAGEHGEKAGVLPTIEQGVVPMLVSIGVFAAVLAILSAKVWPAIAKGLSDREHKIKSEIEAAEKARADAKAALEGYERALADARSQAQKELDAAKAAATAAANELKAKSEADMAAAKDKAMREIDAAKKQALAEIYGEASGLATMVAGKILQRELNAGDQQRLVNDCLTQLQSVGTRN